MWMVGYTNEYQTYYTHTHNKQHGYFKKHRE